MEPGLLDILKLIARAVVGTFGDRCEVVIHDLTKPESSILWIEGDVTGRSVGGPATDLLMRELERGEIPRILSYRGYAGDKILNSSTVLFRDSTGCIGALCTNLDVTDFVIAEDTLRSVWRLQPGEEEEAFVKEFSELVDMMIARAAQEIGTPFVSMSKDEKVRFLGLIDEMGAFRARTTDAVAAVASCLDVSRATVYNYLNQARAAREKQRGNADKQ